MNARTGSLILVLHTHLPWVLHHGRWPHGSDWLCEAAVECYLPLLRMLESRTASPSTRLTLSVSPVLAEQFEHPDFAPELRAFLVQRRAAAREDARTFAREGHAARAALARRWAREYEDALADWSAAPDLVGRLRRLEAAGAVELIACAATHGYLPLLASTAAVERQVAVAVESHRRRFGHAPRGMWLPECAYRPAGSWTSPVDAAVSEDSRPGLESVLARNGLDYFFVEHHLVESGAPLAVFSAPERRRALAASSRPDAAPRPGTPRADRPHRAGGSHVVVFGRDPATSRQVWSREGGYPGDARYRDFHKRHDPGGLRYWAVTDPRGDLADKRDYEPAAAIERTGIHAAHFLDGVARHLREHPQATVCAMYDTELFGHWWHEGPSFLAAVLDRAPAAGVPIVAAGDAAEAARGAPRLDLREGSWGEGGGHGYWLHAETRGYWAGLHDVELAFEAVARRALSRRDAGFDRVMAQALREVMLLEASDWPFLVTAGAAADYAAARATGHAADARRLVEIARRHLDGDSGLSIEDEEFVAGCERRDAVFPWLDWRTGLREPPAAAAIRAPEPEAPDPAWLSAIPGPDRPVHRARGSSASSSRSRAGLRLRPGARDS